MNKYVPKQVKIRQGRKEKEGGKGQTSLRCKPYVSANITISLRMNFFCVFTESIKENITLLMYSMSPDKKRAVSTPGSIFSNTLT